MVGWVIGMSLLGIGTALVYPTLLAAISDVAHPKWRATSLGVYRFWRDLGFVFGAIGNWVSCRFVWIYYCNSTDSTSCSRIRNFCFDRDERNKNLSRIIALHFEIINKLTAINFNLFLANKHSS